MSELKKNVFFKVENYLICEVSGADRERYIQGRITQDVKSLKDFEVKSSLLLTPQGKISAKFDIAKLENSFLLLIEPTAQQEFEDSLLRFKVADDVQLDFKQEALSLVSVQGEKSAEILETLASKDLNKTDRIIQQNSINEISIQVIEKYRSLDSGFDLIFNKEDEIKITEALKASRLMEVNTEQEQLLRICAGIPKSDIELAQSITATEIPYDSLISFTKGCYAGQETVEMSIARGRPNRTLLTLTCEGKETFKLKTPLTFGDKKAGFITSSGQLESENKTVCLAFVKTALVESEGLDSLKLLANEKELTYFKA